MSKSQWYLEGFLGAGRTWEVRIESLPFTVGRHKDSDLTLSSKEVSRNHAEISGTAQSDSLWLRDMGSTNGTYVNRQRLGKDAKPSLLKDGDVLHFGSLEFRVTQRQPAEADAPGDVTTTSVNIEQQLPDQFVSHASEFDDLIAKRAVVSQFRPIIGLSDRRPIGYDVVGFARGAYKGLPQDMDELFTIGERLGKAAELSETLRRAGVEHAKAQTPTRRVFLRVHPAEFNFMGLLKSFQELKRTSGDMPIVAEIRDADVQDFVLLRRFREMLDVLEMGLCYAGFSQGQQRLKELLQVPPDYLKFDSVYIRDLHKQSNESRQILKNLAKMAKDKRISTIAEGIERDEEAAACARLGLDGGQGPFFGNAKAMF